MKNEEICARARESNTSTQSICILNHLTPRVCCYLNQNILVVVCSSFFLSLWMFLKIFPWDFSRSMLLCVCVCAVISFSKLPRALINVQSFEKWKANTITQTESNNNRKEDEKKCCNGINENWNIHKNSNPFEMHVGTHTQRRRERAFNACLHAHLVIFWFNIKPTHFWSD